MTPEQFVYWLQGFFEINDHAHSKYLNEDQYQIIKDHLGKVFNHEQVKIINEFCEPDLTKFGYNIKEEKERLHQELNVAQEDMILQYQHHISC